MTLTGFLRRKSASWPDPESSIGRECMKIQSDVCFEAEGPALDIFLKLAPQIQILLDEHRDDCLSDCSSQPRTIFYHIWMVGHQRAKAKPILIICSKSKPQRLAAKTLIRNSGLLDRFPGVQLKTLERRPVLQANDADSLMAVERNDNTLYTINTPANPCGASLTLGSRRKVTLGGVIIIGGKYYGMTALHRQCGETEETESQDGQTTLAFDHDSDTEEESIDIMSTGSITSEEDTLITFSSPPSSDASDSTCAMGFLSRVSSSLGPGDTIDGSELGSSMMEGSASSVHYQTNEPSYCKIGTLSTDESGDIDYDIFPIDDPYYHVPNLLAITTEDESQNYLHPVCIAAKATEREVWVATGSSGAVKGTLLRSPYYIRMGNSRSFQEMWQVSLTRRTTRGDSGAWVLDAVTGDIYGHVVAADPDTGFAFIIPAFKIWDDIEKRHGKEALLPNYNDFGSTIEDFPRQSPEMSMRATITRDIPVSENQSTSSMHTSLSAEAVGSNYTTPTHDDTTVTFEENVASAEKEITSSISSAGRSDHNRDTPDSSSKDNYGPHYVFPFNATKRTRKEKTQKSTGQMEHTLEHQIRRSLSPHQTGAGACSLWTKEQDQQLMDARKRDLNWVSIKQAYFPDKTVNACRKRHERLVKKLKIDEWDSQKFERVAKEYMSLRKQMWTMLADRVGEKWQVVESKCLEKGWKNIQAAGHSASGKEQHNHPAGTSVSGKENRTPKQDKSESQKFEWIAIEYKNMRELMWSELANRVGEKWYVVESKCLDKVFKDIQRIARSAVMKQKLKLGLNTRRIPRTGKNPSGEVNCTSNQGTYGDDPSTDSDTDPDCDIDLD